MNNFEEKITNEYVKHHAKALLKESIDISNSLSDVTDFEQEQIQKNQMSVSVTNRMIYLALKDYHNCLSHILTEHGITLPDFDTLVDDSAH